MRLGLLVMVLALLVPPAALRAQQEEVRGQVIDSAGRPVPDQTVLLHRVLGMSGASIGQARSDSAGGFAIMVDSAANPEAVYFLATRYRDELYISETFQGPITATRHILQVGVPGTSATAMLEGTSTAPPAGAGSMPVTGAAPEPQVSWLLVVATLAVLGGVALYFFLQNRPGITERRRLLASIAELDIRQGEAADEGYRTRRAELLNRLRELTGP